jgi:hypothetical protein
MSVEHSVEWVEKDIEVSAENLPQCRFVHHKSLMLWPWPELGLPRREAGDKSLELRHSLWLWFTELLIVYYTLILIYSRGQDLKPQFSYFGCTNNIEILSMVPKDFFKQTELLQRQQQKAWRDVTYRCHVKNRRRAVTGVCVFTRLSYRKTPNWNPLLLSHHFRQSGYQEIIISSYKNFSNPVMRRFITFPLHQLQITTGTKRTWPIDRTWGTEESPLDDSSSRHFTNYNINL